MESGSKESDVNLPVDSMIREAQLGYDGLPAKEAKAIQDDFRFAVHMNTFICVRITRSNNVRFQYVLLMIKHSFGMYNTE